MRFIPMSVSEQCELEERMLEHFGYRGDTNVYSLTKDGTIRTVKVKKILNEKKAGQALTISLAFFHIAELPDAPVDAREMELAIRYELSYTWLGWLLFKHFARPIIRFLWNEYHKR